MIDEKIENFLQKGNMDYLYCLLCKLEAHRINQFPSFVKQKFDKKLTVMAMEHVADNEVPDYVSELDEAERILAAERALYEEDEDAIEFGEETIDDSAKFVKEIEATDITDYDTLEEVKDPFADLDDDDEIDIENDDDEEDDEV
ncbi:MAG: hypothetical protein RBR69_07560 [Candidatus Cloacimonadaceae bacterium]|jgi:hypothetical protein|nr:hypothetical protein [Candidatus Cloacimonadota bacterium]MDY0127971.1 hypothetical protein [Candidatus Cloacimonadaceae bacterium]MCB5254969.1 hypothetical protein [Candidatus Cloacimonadota bacterium]MCK9178678.1 hypothetical protein [Candidatus Cloacimonadota bacterium]MCK9242777.1 hypothetical protein [Candidatus Cloacimonadota bacterium]